MRAKWVLIGAATGAAGGVAAHFLLGESAALDAFVRYVTQPVGQIFLRLLFMLVIPLIVSALALGVAGLGDLKSLGRIGLKTLAYTVVVSAIAVVIGVALVNVLRPGRRDVGRDAARGWPSERPSAPPASATAAGAEDRPRPADPDRPRQPGARRWPSGDMLAVMFFALLLGIGLVARPAPTRRAASRRRSRGSTTSP